jgi:uncharacterized protein YyaL (SSP411 family)
MPNRLAGASSPYLRSHAENPVDWWPWGPEPFAEAARRDVPVMVSIGYSTCHWCHVMARESFSDPAIAALLNERFVAIKVDREEHLEVDAAYLAAASAFTQNLGWPLTSFTTPAGRTFFAGTYWPPTAMQGVPAFRDVLVAVLDAWDDRREHVEGIAKELGEAIAQATPALRAPVDLDAAVARLAELEDPQFGGFGYAPAFAPKFPHGPALRFLLDRGERELAARLLDATAGLADPDGGFYRYATMRNWSEPHYERMLHDNAQLLGAYAIAGRRELAEGIATFLLTVLREPGGAFRSAQDSESGGVEGAWYRLPPAERANAVPPGIDGKVLTGWNGLAIESLALAGRLLRHPEWVDAAATAADRVTELNGDGRSSLDGVRSSAPATLEDLGGMANGLLELAVSTGEVSCALRARDLVARADALQGDPVLAAQGIDLAIEPSDGALPSGPSALARARWTLYLLTADRRYADAARDHVESLASLITRDPLSFGAALQVAHATQSAVTHEVVVTEGPDPMADAARSRTDRFAIVVTSAQAAAFAAAGFDLFEAKTAIGGAATLYACTDFVCELPVVSGASGSADHSASDPS